MSLLCYYADYIHIYSYTHICAIVLQKPDWNSLAPSIGANMLNSMSWTLNTISYVLRSTF